MKILKYKRTFIALSFILFTRIVLADWTTNECILGVAPKSIKLRYHDGSSLASSGTSATILGVQKITNPTIAGVNDKTYPEKVYVEVAAGARSEVYLGKMYPQSILVENKTKLVDSTSIPLEADQTASTFIDPMGNVYVLVRKTSSQMAQVDSLLQRSLYKSVSRLPNPVTQFEQISMQAVDTFNYPVLNYIDTKNKKVLHRIDISTGQEMTLTINSEQDYIVQINEQFVMLANYSKLMQAFTNHPNQALPAVIYDLQKRSYLPSGYKVYISAAVEGQSPEFTIKDNRNQVVKAIKYDFSNFILSPSAQDEYRLPGVGHLKIQNASVGIYKLNLNSKSSFINIYGSLNSPGQKLLVASVSDLICYPKNSNANVNSIVNTDEISISELQAVFLQTQAAVNVNQLRQAWSKPLNLILAKYAKSGYAGLSVNEKWMSMAWIINQKKIRQTELAFALNFYNEFLGSKNKTIVNEMLRMVIGKLPVNYQSSTFLGPALSNLGSSMIDIQSLPLTKESIDWYAKELAAVLLKIYQQKALQNSLSINDLIDLRKYKNILSKDQKEAVANQVGDYLAPLATANGSVLQGAFPSLINWMITQRVREIFGLNIITLNDIWITPVAGSSYYQYSLLSTDEIFSSEFPQHLNLQRLPSGIFYYGKNNFYLTNNYPAYTEDEKRDGRLEKTVRWSTTDEQFKADIFAKPILEAAFASLPLSEINKKEFLQDRVLRGVVVFGSNLDRQTIEWTLGDYIEYLKARGFKIIDKAKLNDSVEYFKNLIAGDLPMDYLLKEAHSDGDMRNLLSIQKDGYVIKASKTVKSNSLVGVNSNMSAGTTTEEVYLLFGDGNYLNPVYISNQEMAKWIKERDLKRLGQLIYLNASCSSYSKAAAELTAIKSESFVEIPSITSVPVFRNSEDNIMFKMLEGIRQFQTFKELSEEQK